MAKTKSTDWSKNKMTEPVTVIGSHTVISGNLEGDEDLTIEGRVEGTISLSRTLTIEVNGVVHANINVRNAVISGVLVGNVEAEDSVHITEEGRVMGDISAPRVILVDGASFRGSIDMGEFDIERGDLPQGMTRETVRAAPRAVSSQRREPEPPPVEVVEEPEPQRAQPEPRTPTRVRTASSAASSAASKAARAAAAQRAAASAKTEKPKPKPSKVPAAKKPAPAPKVRAVKKAKASRKKR